MESNDTNLFNPAEVAITLYSYGLSLSNQGRHMKALEVFYVVLQLQYYYQDIPPFVCKVDIARTHLSVSLTLRLISRNALAEDHRNAALDHLIGFYGTDDVQHLHFLCQNVHDASWAEDSENVEES